MLTAEEFPFWLGQHKNAVKCAVVDPILWALGWKTWLPQECLPDCPTGNRGHADYVLLDQTEQIAVVMLVQPSGLRRRDARTRLWRLVRGMTHGVGLLIFGSVWEIYDLTIRSRNPTGKFVEELSLGADFPDEVETIASVLSQWVSKGQQ